ncbi:MAG TPA: hypothetical protein PK821_03280 [Victivallales bacterium]|nr:hypothetical protein [Victivallales bacterium]
MKSYYFLQNNTKMFLWTCIAALIIGVCACSSTKTPQVKIPPNYTELMRFRTAIAYGGSGTSVSDAIIIKGAVNSSHGIELEEMLLKKMFPGFIPSEQFLLKNDKNVFDCWEVFVAGGKKERIFFDITEFYEK